MGEFFQFEDTVDIIAFAVIALAVAYIVYQVAQGLGWLTGNQNSAASSTCSWYYLWVGC
jgi:hypothetical protein